MSHFAKVIDGVVTQLVVATQEEINSERHGDAFLWVQCSYNGNFRKSYPSIGSTYDGVNFKPKQHSATWIFNEEEWVWYPPVDYPNDGNMHLWNEEQQEWVLLIEEEQ